MRHKNEFIGFSRGFGAFLLAIAGFVSSITSLALAVERKNDDTYTLYELDCVLSATYKTDTTAETGLLHRLHLKSRFVVDEETDQTVHSHVKIQASSGYLSWRLKEALKVTPKATGCYRDKEPGAEFEIAPLPLKDFAELLTEMGAPNMPQLGEDQLQFLRHKIGVGRFGVSGGRFSNWCDKYEDGPELIAELDLSATAPNGLTYRIYRESCEAHFKGAEDWKKHRVGH